MKKSREEEGKRKLKVKAENRPGTSANQPSARSTKGSSKEKSVKNVSNVRQLTKSPVDLNKHLYSCLLNVDNYVKMFEDIPWLDLNLSSHSDEESDDGKLYVCPEISDDLLPKHEWMDKILEYIILVEESDPILAAILAVKSLNSKEKADECLSVIERYLKNIMEYPENEKYRQIRFLNPIVTNKVIDTVGGLLFLLVIGFEIDADNELSETYIVFRHNHFHFKEIINMISSVNGFQLKEVESLDEIESGRTCSDGSKENDDFYKLTSTDLKKNQELRSSEIERESQLRTKSTREKEKKSMPKSKNTKIRIRLPEGKHVESTFELSHRLVNVYAFIDKTVANGRKYTLFMPPATPFEESDKEKTLVELQLYPAVLLTLKWQTGNKQPSHNKIKK